MLISREILGVMSETEIAIVTDRKAPRIPDIRTKELWTRLRDQRDSSLHINKVILLWFQCFNKPENRYSVDIHHELLINRFN